MNTYVVSTYSWICFLKTSLNWSIGSNKLSTLMKSYVDIIFRCDLVAYDCLGMINHNFTQQFFWPNMKVFNYEKWSFYVSWLFYLIWQIGSFIFKIWKIWANVFHEKSITQIKNISFKSKFGKKIASKIPLISLIGCFDM